MRRTAKTALIRAHGFRRLHDQGDRQAQYAQLNAEVHALLNQLNRDGVILP